MEVIDKLKEDMQNAVLHDNIDKALPYVGALFQLPFPSQSIVGAMLVNSVWSLVENVPEEQWEIMLNEMITLMRNTLSDCRNVKRNPE